ncbi:HERV-H LTR-associating protein 1 [Pipistrellus kuhlii]|uniref:HERV-H LTR-associating protein 1 n=1 Tax=Pipistrellus kuhlii TaxID=59472 RepID=UPI001E273F22|nr:HERV-H LTR-associating protein 1 [Pipistrellus kuhlii]
MPGLRERGTPQRLRVGLACVLCLWNTVAAVKGESKKETVPAFPLTTGSGNEDAEKEKARALLAATGSTSLAELPARAVDLSSLNLTELVNDMLNRALKDSRKFFSLLSITSYSSFAFHKLSVAVYNISNLKTVDQAKFPTRYCYCLSNRTNDLSDFTALLVDIIGNSTSYLTEIFKSTSILSVSQTNASDCIFICVMTGKAGRNLSDFWELAEKSPVITYTFTSSLAAAPARGTSLSALSASPWAEVPEPSEREQAVTTVRLSELLAKATATATAKPGSVSPALPGSATRRAAGTPWVTDGGLAWASTQPVPRAPTTGEDTPGGPPWEARSSAATSPAEAKVTGTTGTTGTTGSLWEPPAGTRGSPSRTSLASGTPTPGTQTSSPTKAPAPRYPHTDDNLRPFPAGEELAPGPHRVHVSNLSQQLYGQWGRTPGLPVFLSLQRSGQGHRHGAQSLTKGAPEDILVDSTGLGLCLPGCPQQVLRDGPVTAGPLPGAAHKLTPCLMELCWFFQQCLCASPRRDPRTEAMRSCLEYYSWFLKNATHICQKAKRLSHSHTLKQRCLEHICKSV